MIVILDIETQQLIPEDRNLKSLRISIAGARHNGIDRMFDESQVKELFALLDNAELIVGHNLLNFDYRVLQNYADFDVKQRYKDKTLDFQHVIVKKTDRLVSLNDLAKRNLGQEKLGVGKDAPALFSDGKFDELKSYLAYDLRLTNDLFEHVRKHGKLKYGHIVYQEPEEREVLITISDR